MIKKSNYKGIKTFIDEGNSVRELEQDVTSNGRHITGGNNNSDMFTKEDKDVSHFIKYRDSNMT